MAELDAKKAKLGAKKVKLAVAIGEDLLEARKQLEHGAWLPWLTEVCKLTLGLGPRQACFYVTLAEHRPRVEAYLNRASNLGTTPSIRGALEYIASQDGKRPKKPKKVSELTNSAILGAHLDGHRESFWEALQFAPGLKAEIIKRLPPKIVVEVPRGAAEAAAEALEIQKLVVNASASNAETIRDKAARITRLLGPPKPAPPAPCNVKLDLGALPKALTLEPPDLDIPEFLQRTVH
jgi:hypothetical protein